MQTLCGILALAAICGGQAATSAPYEQDAILARVSKYARGYTQNLRDFICLQSTRRSRGFVRKPGRWKKLDTFDEELTYFQKKERYRLLRVNGKPATDFSRLKPGHYFARSEFGSFMNWIFHPDAKAEFHLARRDAGVCVFGYRVPQSGSKMFLQVNQFKGIVAFHGFVHADCDTGMVRRIQVENEPPVELQAGGVTDLLYDTALIGGQKFFLPARVEHIARFGSLLTKVDIEFRDYRKYDAQTTVKFEAP